VVTLRDTECYAKYLNVIVKFTFSELLVLFMFEFRCTLCLHQ